MDDQSVYRLDGHRTLAWRRVELCDLGNLLCSSLNAGETGSPAFSEEASDFLSLLRIVFDCDQFRDLRCVRYGRSDRSSVRNDWTDRCTGTFGGEYLLFEKLWLPFALCDGWIHAASQISCLQG